MAKKPKGNIDNLRKIIEKIDDTCKACKGTGGKPSNPCPVCNGSGKVRPKPLSQ